jgi:hypothetical protein
MASLEPSKIKGFKPYASDFLYPTDAVLIVLEWIRPEIF